MVIGARTVRIFMYEPKLPFVFWHDYYNPLEPRVLGLSPSSIQMLLKKLTVVGWNCYAYVGIECSFPDI